MNYIGTCKDRNNANIRVEIVTSQGSGNRDITIVADGITITYDSDSIFKPIKKSGATIEILTDNLVSDFYTGTLLDPKVFIYRNNTLIWFGYVTPTVFTQPYVNEKETLTLNCIDTLANLEYVDYTYYGTATSVTLLIDIIKHILTKTDPNGIIKTIFCTRSISVNNSVRILEELACIERNFSDEIEDVMKCDEVLEEICKFLGVCMFQYRNAYYIVDYMNLRSAYTAYNRFNDSAVNVITYIPVSISSIGVGADDANITLDGVYNKVTVVANTLKASDPISSSSGSSSDDNTTSDLFQNMTLNNDFNGEFETVDIWVNPNVDTNDSSNFTLGGIDFMSGQDSFPRRDNVWDVVAHDGWKHYKYLDAWFKIGSQWTIQYDGIAWASTNNNGIGTSVDVYNGGMSFAKATETFLNSRDREYRWAPTFQWNSSNVKNDGIAIQKVMVYDADGEAPSEYKWDTYLTAPLKHRHEGMEDYLIKLVKPTVPYKGGAFIINFEFMFTPDENIAAPSIIPVRNWEYKDGTKTMYNGQPAYISERKIVLPAKLRIGNHYWNGNEWKEYTTSFYQKIQDGYFNKTVSYVGYQTDGKHYHYRIWNDSWNGWQYCTETEWSNSSALKERIELENFEDTYWHGAGYYITTEPYYIVKDTNTDVTFTAPQEYYDEYISDRFFLYKKFDNGNKVYNTKYKLTNTATPSLNLSSGAEGIAIKLPTEETFSGDFEFSFGRPTRHFEALTPGQNCGSSISGIVMHISDLYVKYSTVDNSQSAFEKKNTNNDITYTNVINNGYVQEYDDVQLKINTYNSTISSFSYILDSNSQYVENVTYDGTSKKMEQHLIDKYVSHYSSPKFKYCGTLHDVNISPCSIVHQSQLNKDLAVYKAEYNILNNTVEIESVEL